MPSINRPTWRGVSTTWEQSAIHHLSQELHRLEQSTNLMRQNLVNANTARTDNPSEIIIPDNVGLVDLAEEWKTEGDLSDLLNVAQSLEASSEELKQKIKNVLKSNSEIKTEMKTYFQQSQAWSLTFQEESKKIEAELQIITSPKPLELEPTSGVKFTTIITNKARNWYNLFGTAGRNAILNVRRKWEAADLRRVLILPEDINNDGSYYALLPYF